jgi:Lrp/AsnC family transcriptional regulator, regulator for asnA, asnC and gidA
MTAHTSSEHGNRYRGSAYHGLPVANLDRIDQQIVMLLQDDGRASITSIADEIGLSHAGTRQRLQRLLGTRIVAIGAVTNPATHGYSRQASMILRTGPDSRGVAETIARIPEVYYVVLLTGRVDVLVEFFARDDLHLERLIGDIRRIDGVVDTEVLPFLDTIKWNYAPGFPEDALT